MTRYSSRRCASVGAIVLGAIALAGCAGGAPAATSELSAATAEEPADLEALISAAQEEGPITIYDGTSKVEEMAASFTEKYGIEATGVKSDAAETIEKVTREAQAGNVVGDVVAISDMPAVNNQLLPNDFVFSWIPADLEADIDEGQRDPLVVISDPSMWTYNSEVYDVCPVDNVWQLTESDWAGNVVMQDPVGNSGALDWFSQMAQFGDEELREAYAEEFGEELDTEQPSAAAEWVSRLAANDPLLTKSSEEASEAIGALGQTDPPVGLISSAKYRNNDEKGYGLEVCEGLNPWVGEAAPKALMVASGSENPNAAKLFVHFALTEEGIAPQIADGKISSNLTIEQPDDPARVGEFRDDLFFAHGDGFDTDWADREVWQDLWRTSRG